MPKAWLLQKKTGQRQKGCEASAITASRKNDQKLTDQYEDSTDILLGKVEAGLWSDDPAGSGSVKTVSPVPDKLRDVVLPFFTAMGVLPEKTEQCLAQVYREIKTSDTKKIICMVYDLVNRKEEKQEETLDQHEEKDLREGSDYTGLAEKGILDEEKW